MEYLQHYLHFSKSYLEKRFTKSLFESKLPVALLDESVSAENQTFSTCHFGQFPNQNSFFGSVGNAGWKMFLTVQSVKFAFPDDTKKRTIPGCSFLLPSSTPYTYTHARIHISQHKHPQKNVCTYSSRIHSQGKEGCCHRWCQVQSLRKANKQKNTRFCSEHLILSQRSWLRDLPRSGRVWR